MRDHLGWTLRRDGCFTLLEAALGSEVAGQFWPSWCHRPARSSSCVTPSRGARSAVMPARCRTQLACFCLLLSSEMLHTPISQNVCLQVLFSVATGVMGIRTLPSTHPQPRSQLRPDHVSILDSDKADPEDAFVQRISQDPGVTSRGSSHTEGVFLPSSMRGFLNRFPLGPPAARRPPSFTTLPRWPARGSSVAPLPPLSTGIHTFSELPFFIASGTTQRCAHVLETFCCDTTLSLTFCLRQPRAAAYWLARRARLSHCTLWKASRTCGSHH